LAFLVPVTFPCPVLQLLSVSPAWKFNRHAYVDGGILVGFYGICTTLIIGTGSQGDERSLEETLPRKARWIYFLEDGVGAWLSEGGLFMLYGTSFCV